MFGKSIIKYTYGDEFFLTRVSNWSDDDNIITDFSSHQWIYEITQGGIITNYLQLFQAVLSVRIEFTSRFCLLQLHKKG